jgi:hypothetical protein
MPRSAHKAHKALYEDQGEFLFESNAPKYDNRVVGNEQSEKVDFVSKMDRIMPYLIKIVQEYESKRDQRICPGEYYGIDPTLDKYCRVNCKAGHNCPKAICDCMASNSATNRYF